MWIERLRRSSLAAGAVAVLLAGCTSEAPDGSVAARTGSEGAAGDTAAGQGAAGLRALHERLAELEHRRSLIRDANDIKRLQRAYGYYLDEALWDEMTDLFADGATIEIGLDGIYVGKERIREYLYALGGGRSGLAEGELNEHMQVMPVVTVAPDGMTAKGRWRAIIMAGELGGDAYWGEGPYENEYVKENGVWKISKVHWFQSVIAPYEEGWLDTPDETGGKWVSDRLPPDRPPTIEYQMWPATHLPPFHFANPVLGAAVPDPGRHADRPAPAGALSLEALAARAAMLEQQVRLLEDENRIENLQRIYGYYVDKGLWSEAASLFADEGTIEIGGSGVYEGPARIRAFLGTLGEEFPQQGRLLDRMQLQPVVHVAPDGMTAKARWRLFAQEAVWHEYAQWGTGVYENEYVKEDGVWKIRSLHAYHTMYTPYEDGWGRTALVDGAPSEALPPDRPPSVDYAPFPAVFVVPFHYENPVTGGPVYEAAPARFAPAPVTTVEALESQLTALERGIVRLEDFDALERLNAIYGYYLAHSQWDNLAGIFAPDGQIEIAMRGVYIGRPSVRRNLDLYTRVGMEHGLLHNHMQFQPVITVADDGRTARMRSRALSIMGQFGRYAQWMGGIYENRFVKIDGIWQIQEDHQLNTYFAPYAVGWKDLAPRPPPGVTASNPPDAPPTIPFEMYPAAFLPPFHYANPVTGRTVTWPPDN